ncbi:hypothetical protein IW261DRAFT_1564763 [Armillaria novae-zelandiae]|uniref:Uncharacterized protein n=1 Tax=Armillaria novae-zelandiae TaxID=153914 RepID=A0AA39P6V9_9AGAR|nr:hypothetical protein IW261DRAFT_1564763 [Armillaria novae-zelandiae]
MSSLASGAEWPTLIGLYWTNFVEYCQRIEVNDNVLNTDIDKLSSGNQYLHLTEFIIILKTTDTFAATTICTWPAIPQFPNPLILNKRFIEYLSRFNKWPTQLGSLQELDYLSDKAPIIDLLFQYKKHKKQVFWVGIAAQVDSIAIYLGTHIFLNTKTADAPNPNALKPDSDSSNTDLYVPDRPTAPVGKMMDAFLNELYQLMETKSIANSFLDKANIKHEMSD